MKRVICKRGKTKPGLTSVLLTRDDFTLVMRDVPAEICEVCGEDNIDRDVLKTCITWPNRYIIRERFLMSEHINLNHVFPVPLKDTIAAD